MGVSAQNLAAAYPSLYHMAEAGSWPSIQKYGLLSTTSLLTLFELQASVRSRIESAHRPESIVIKHAELGTAVVRDQIPMREQDLVRCLRDDMTPREWYQLLNSKVFFWLTEQRLQRMLGARAYRDRPHTVLILDTAALLADYTPSVVLSSMNSGCTRPVAHPRGKDTFQPLARYPFAERRRRGLEAVVELAVEGGVKNIATYTREVHESSADGSDRTIWTP